MSLSASRPLPVALMVAAALGLLQVAVASRQVGSRGAAGSTAIDPDSDNDGWTDDWEVILDDNPLDPSHYPRGNQPPGGC